MMTPECLTKNVLVTGATGFVGAHLVEELLRRGYSVTCLVRRTSNTEQLKKCNVHIATGDLTDPESVKKALGRIDAVFHVAGAIKALRREDYFRINHIGTRNLLQAVAQTNPDLKRFIYISSLAASGPSNGNQKLTEISKPNPVSWYGQSKLEAEREVLRFRHMFPVTILRPCAVYGPRDRETLIAVRMIQRGCLFTPGRFERRFSLIYVKDLADEIVRAGEHETESGQIYFLSRPEIYTWDDVGRAAAKFLGKRFRRVSFPEELFKIFGVAGDLYARLVGRPSTINSQKVKELLQPSWLCDSSKAEAGLGFRPATDLETGMRETVCWYQEHGWL